MARPGRQILGERGEIDLDGFQFGPRSGLLIDVLGEISRKTALARH